MKQTSVTVLDRPSVGHGALSAHSQYRPIVVHTVGFGLFLMVIAVPGAPAVTWGLLLLWSLLGVGQSLQALTLLMLTRLLNPAVYEFGDASVALFYVVLLVACSRIFFGALAYKRKKFKGPLLLLIFGLYGAFNTGVFSYYPIVSLTKIILFTYTSCAIIVGFQICAQRRMDWAPWFLGMWLAVVTLSIPALLVSGIGYARDGQGFQGILSHPQTFAVYLAPMVCWMLGQYLFVRERLSFLWLAVLAVVMSLIFMTLARTAVVTVIASLVLVFLFSARYRRLIIGILRKPQGFALIFITLVALPFVEPDKLISDFVMKGSEAQGIGEAYQHSRGLLIARAWESFLSHPFVGIGFGVSFEEYFSPVYDSLTGLPISAATEKSLLPIVLLEELGIGGLILFIPVLYQIIRIGGSSKGLAVPLLILGCLMVNIGEAVLFSIAGLGLYLWLLMGWGLSTAMMEQTASATDRRDRTRIRRTETVIEP